MILAMKEAWAHILDNPPERKPLTSSEERELMRGMSMLTPGEVHDILEYLRKARSK